MNEPEAAHEALRALPAVDAVVDGLRDGDAPAPVVTGVARQAIDEARATIRAGGQPPSFDAIVARGRELLAEHARSLLHPVINATGVLIHTNLGRVPLGRRQLDAVARVASGYSNLEYDVAAGGRGSRYVHAQRLLVALTGAEAALVVNNNAAAVLLALAALCAPREVVISRGELIEIGGEFRIPEILAASGARLVEVGTTNRTHLADYERALGPDTAAILKVHPSNYRVVGFTATVAARDLARLARGRKVAFIHDLGSGLISPPDDAPWVQSEPPVDVALGEGADVVTFSGDKLLGGPQAGVIVGRREHIEKISKHPLLRALRVDKMTLAALEETLLAYLQGRPHDLPLWQMAAAPLEELERRARAVVAAVSPESHPQQGGPGLLPEKGPGLLPEKGPGLLLGKVEAVATSSVAGGGSLPGTELSSWGVAVTHAEKSPDELARGLRRSDPPVIARVEDDRVLLDLRTVVPADDDLLASALTHALA